jgi:hypothetical protein
MPPPQHHVKQEIAGPGNFSPLCLDAGLGIMIPTTGYRGELGQQALLIQLG